MHLYPSGAILLSVSHPLSASITIRPAYADDEPAIARLAQLDSAGVPAGPLLLAEVDGELRAALSVSEETVIADPFHRTLELVELLRGHAERARRPRPRWRRARSKAGLLGRGLLRPA